MGCFSVGKNSGEFCLLCDIDENLILLLSFNWCLCEDKIAVTAPSFMY